MKNIKFNSAKMSVFEYLDRAEYFTLIMFCSFFVGGAIELLTFELAGMVWDILPFWFVMLHIPFMGLWIYMPPVAFVLNKWFRRPVNLPRWFKKLFPRQTIEEECRSLRRTLPYRIIFYLGIVIYLFASPGIEHNIIGGFLFLFIFILLEIILCSTPPQR